MNSYCIIVELFIFIILALDNQLFNPKPKMTKKSKEGFICKRRFRLFSKQDPSSPIIFHDDESLISNE